MIRIVFLTSGLFVSSFSFAQAMKHFHPGDRAIYSVNASGYTGTADMTVHSVTRAGVWLHETIDVSMIHEELYQLVDPETGTVKRLIKDGEEQTPPRPEVVATSFKRVAVPAGRYESVYKRLHLINEGTTSEQWVDVDHVPGLGFVKLTGVNDGYPFVAELQQVQMR